MGVERKELNLSSGFVLMIYRMMRIGSFWEIFTSTDPWIIETNLVQDS
jgi:hypothetical protein